MHILEDLPQHPTQKTSCLDSLVPHPLSLWRNPTRLPLMSAHWETLANPPPSFLIHKSRPCPLLLELHSTFCTLHVTTQVVRCMTGCSLGWVMNPRKARTGSILFEKCLAKITTCEINGQSFWWLLYRIYPCFMPFGAHLYLWNLFSFLTHFVQYYSNYRFQTH